MSKKIEETCKHYWEIPEKYIFFFKFYTSANKGPFGYLDASIWQYGC